MVKEKVRLNTTKTLDKLNEHEAELKRQNEEDRVIIADENTSPSETEATEERVAEKQEELGWLRTQVGEREKGPCHFGSRSKRSSKNMA